MLVLSDLVRRCVALRITLRSSPFLRNAYLQVTQPSNPW